MRRVNKPFTVFSLLATLLCSSSAAFQHRQPPVAWPPGHGTIIYYVNSTGYPGESWDPALLRVHDAFKIWEESTWGTIRFVYDNSAQPARGFVDDDMSTISFGDPNNDVPPGLGASTKVYANPNETFVVNGITFCTLTQVDIVFNTDTSEPWHWDQPSAIFWPSCKNSLDILDLAVHEVGHMYGLDHELSDNKVTMYPIQNVCESIVRSPEQDDVDGVWSMYPPPGNSALHKPYTVRVWSGTYENTELSGDEITDGSLAYAASTTDACAGWQNLDDNEELGLEITIDLGEPCRVSSIRYNPGDVQRADTWSADIFSTPFGQTGTNPSFPFVGVWTEHTGSFVGSSVTVILTKTKTSPTTDWLFIGEIECIAEPIAGAGVQWSNITGPNNLNTDPDQALGIPDEIPVSLGVGGNININLGLSRSDEGGLDFTVHESLSPRSAFHSIISSSPVSATTDTTAEGYTVSVVTESGSQYGVGSGFGTTSFDLSTLNGCTSFTSIIIMDDGDGDPNGTSPGFELDGISFVHREVLPDTLTVLYKGGIFRDGGPAAWKLDGSGMYVSSYFWGGEDRIYFLSSGGTEFTDLGLTGIEPVLSPDGTKLLYHGLLRPPLFDTFTNHIIIFNLNDSSADTLFTFTTEGFHMSYPSWSPDGAEIRFYEFPNIKSIPASGGTPSTILVMYGLYDLRWSPSGNEIAITTHDHGYTCCSCRPCDGCPYMSSPKEYELFIKAYPSGSLIGSIKLGKSTNYVAWSPDGNYLACAVRTIWSYYPTNLWILTKDLSRSTQITNMREYFSIDQAHLGGSRWLSWSPTSNRIVFTSPDYYGNELFQVSFSLDQLPTGVVDSQEQPKIAHAVLYQNYPNPFNPNTTITYSISTFDHVSIRIYDVTGRLVQTLIDEGICAGEHTVMWDASNNSGQQVASGVYFVRLKTTHETNTKKLLLLK